MPRRLSALLAAGMSAVLLTGTTGTAAARAADTIEVDKQPTYTCTHPVVGPYPTQVRIRTTFPASVSPGEQIQPGEVRLELTVGSNLDTWYRIVGVATLSGTADWGMGADLGGRTVPVDIPDLALPTQEVPREGPMIWPFAGAPVEVTPTEPGGVRFDAVPDFTMTLSMYDENGDDTALRNPVDLPCVLAADQDTHLATIPVTE